MLLSFLLPASLITLFLDEIPGTRPGASPVHASTPQVQSWGSQHLRASPGISSTRLRQDLEPIWFYATQDRSPGPRLSPPDSGTKLSVAVSSNCADKNTLL